MGGRAENGTPIGLHLTKNDDTDKWEAREQLITYCMSFSQMDDLKRKYKYLDSVAAWYNQLPKEEKKSVTRLGLPDNTTYYDDREFID